MNKKKPPGPKPQGKALSQREKAMRSLQYWLARIYTRALADLLRGKKDV